MRMRPAVTIILSLTILMPWASGIWAAEMRITLREQLNVHWQKELLTYPFTAPPGECRQDVLALVGPTGPMPAQFIEVRYWPGGTFVKNAQVAFVSDLVALETRNFSVQCDARSTAGNFSAPDLQIRPDKEQIELVTSRFGLRLLLGEKHYTSPIDAAQVPGPLLGFQAPDGTWYGGSRLYGPGKITHYSAKLVEGGPVLGRMRVLYSYEDGRTLELIIQLAAGGGHALWDMRVEPYNRQLAAQLTAGVNLDKTVRQAMDTAAKDGFELLLSPNLADLRLKVRPFPAPNRTILASRWGGLQMDKHNKPLPIPAKVNLGQEQTGELLRLMPWAGWWDQMDTTSFVFGTATLADLLFVAVRDGGDWVEPAAPGTWASYGNPTIKYQQVPLVKDPDGDVSLRFSAVPGLRKWQTGTVENSQWLAHHWIDNYKNTIPSGLWPLNQVKDLVLDWPGDIDSHPRVFGTRQDLERLRKQDSSPERLRDLRNYIKNYGYINIPSHRDPNALILWLLTGRPEDAKEAKLVERLRTYLGNLGRMDRMRGASQLASLYDALADSGLLAPQDRKLFQAQIAFLAYICADPSNWSMERGFASGNQNMSVAHILNLGILAATLPEHPMAQEWSRPALAMMEKWLTESVGPKGEWPESLANYAEVSASMIAVYAVAAKNASLHDFTVDPRFKRLLLYLAKHYTPPDPRPFDGHPRAVAVSPPSGRGPAYHPVTGIFGLIAKATAETDPEFSQTLQWLWMRGGQSMGYISDRMGGLEILATDGALPARIPDWTSEQFPLMDVLLRHGVGNPLEYYANLVMDPKGYTAYYSENGGFAAIWAKGVPTTVRFAGHGYGEREEIFISRVLLARQPGNVADRKQRFMYAGPMAVTAFSALPRQDYAVADMRLERPITKWHGPKQQEPTLNLPRWSTVTQEGQPPLDWRRQVLFLKGDESSEPAYFLLRDTVSSNQPTMWQFWTLSDKIGTPDEAKNLQNFLADKPGERNVDAREIEGDRFTAVGQLGVDIEYYIAAPTDTPRHTLRWGHRYYYHYSEYQDMLHLQLPGAGVYFVAYYPRPRHEPAPNFTTLGDGKIIKVAGDWGADYGFLSASAATVVAEGTRFEGTAGSVQLRKNELVLSLAAPGTVAFEPWILEAAAPCSLRVLNHALVLELDRSGGPIMLTGPHEWRPRQLPPGIELEKVDGSYRLTVPAGLAQVRLER